MNTLPMKKKGNAFALGTSLALFAFFSPSLAFADVYTLEELGAGETSDFTVEKYDTNGILQNYKVEVSDFVESTGTTFVYYTWTPGSGRNMLVSTALADTDLYSAIDSSALRDSTVTYDSVESGSDLVANLTDDTIAAITAVGYDPSKEDYTVTAILGFLVNANCTSVDDNYDYDFTAVFTKTTTTTDLAESVSNIDYIGQRTTAVNSIATGGAVSIASGVELSFTNVNFVSNFVKKSGSHCYGGAIYNLGTITGITGSFIANSAEIGTKNNYGGAIYNKGTISGNVVADFVANFCYSTSVASYGGAIYNDSIISAAFTSNFIGNFVSTNGAAASGGAIYNASTFSGNITGDFLSNYVQSATNNAGYGGAIFNNSTFSGSITGDFIGNYALSTTGTTAQGGAIYNSSDMTGGIEGNIVNNYAKSLSTSNTNAYGGAVYNSGSILFTASEGKTYSYTGNYVYADSDDGKYLDANGGFLYQTSGGVTNFNTEEGASIIIGIADNAGYDSIAGLGTINKNGAGSLVVNSSMEYYTGSLSVSAGSMEVNNTLGASVISIESGASLSVDILAIYLGETSSLSLTNEGDLSIDTLAIYLTVDFVEDFNVYLNTEDYDISNNIVSYELYDSNGDLIDNSSYVITDGYLSFATAVPEPSTYAMILGALALGFAYYRRRK